MSGWRVSWARLAVGCALLAWCGGAHAQTSPPNAKAAKPAANSGEVEIARGHFRLGIDSYRDGDLDTALIEFRRAYSAAPNYRLLYNLGQVSQELRDYPAAEKYYAQYLQDGDGQLDSARRQEVEYELAKVRLRIASVAITCNIAGAEVFIDDVSAGKTPLSEPLRVSTGQRRIVARAAGYAPIAQVIDAAGGETVEVVLDFLAASSPNKEVAVHAAPETLGRHLNPLALTLLIGTGALAAGAGVMAYLAAHEASDYRAELTRKTTAHQLKTLHDGAKTKAAVTDVLLGATALAAAASVVVIWTNGVTERDNTALRAGPGGVELIGRF